jgi:predicted DNA-binding protein (MmcQ/YjbR family)
MSEPGDVPPEVLDQLRHICLGLPEAYEEPAWIGVRWRIRKRTFAHVYSRDENTMMTFRAPGEELQALVAAGPPFTKADWGVNVVRMSLDGHVDWDEVAELLADSYRVQAPKKLSQRR